ncbi:MAG: translocation/assembly module TamB domain-containing protein, partial [Pseudomonadota bacterium]
GVAAGGARIGRVDGDVRLTDRGSGRTDVSAEVRVPRVAAEGAEVRDIRLAAQVADALGTPRLDARLDVAAVDGEGIALDAPRLTVEGPLSRLAIAFTAAGEAIGKALNAEMRARVDVDGPLDATVDALQVTLDEARIALAEPLRVRAEGAATRIDNLALLLPGGRIVGAARLFPRGAAGQLAIDFDDLGALKTLDEAVPLARGTADVDARFDTRSGSAGAEVTARVAGLGLDGAVADIGDLGLALDGRWNGRVFDADAALSGPFGDPVRVTAGVPLVATGGPAPALNQRGPLRATVDWQGRLGDLWVLVPAPGHVLDGAVLVDLDVGGTPAAPTVGGRLEMADGQYQNLDTGTILTDLAVASQLAGTSDIALEISARDGASGTLDATVALREQTLDATVAVDRAVLVRRDDVTAQISADIAARGPLTGFALTGTTTIDRAEVRLVNAVPPSVADLGDVRIKGEPVPEEAEPAGGDITLDLAVRAPSDVFVRGRGLDSEWQIALDIAGTAAAPRISGSVERRRGELDFLGRVFDLEQGEVIFSGGREINPRLNVVLAHARDDVTGFIRVGGTANAPQVTFTSDPALPEDEVLPRVIFGRSAQSLSGLEALQLAGAVATLLDGTGGTVDQIRGAVGLDVLRLDSDDSGGTSVVVGRNVADGVFVGAKQPIDGGETSVQVEIEVFENITVDGEVGGDGDTSLGVNWRKNF